MRSLVALLSLCFTPCLSGHALAAQDCVKQHIPAAIDIGSGEGRRFVFHAYDATLSAPGGTYDAGKIFALTLRYRMAFSGKMIARESISQMRRIQKHSDADLARWQEQLEKIIPDVTPGSWLTGIRFTRDITVFCSAEGEIGRITDKRFGDAFFGIWLDEKTESPALRRQLIGKK